MPVCPADVGTRPVSVLILARNEESSLPRCLKAVAWSNDVVVVNDDSTDRTAQVAGASGARVVARRFDSFAGQRNWALDTLEWRNEWVLHLDADEVVTPELAAEIVQAVAGGCCDAYRMASKLIFMGRWLRHAATYPTYQVRLGRNPGLRFQQVGHGQREDGSSLRVGTLREPYLHFSFSKGLDDWFERHNHYSAAEANLRVHVSEPLGLLGLLGPDAVRRRRALKRLAAHLPFQPTLRFLWGYILRGGFLDGQPGFEYCRLISIYEAMIAAKVTELKWRG